MVTSSEIKSGLKLFGTAAMRILVVLLACVLSLLHSASHAASPKILEIKTDKGVGAWLVREPSIPIISVQITFRGGTITDPVGK